MDSESDISGEEEEVEIEYIEVDATEIERRAIAIVDEEDEDLEELEESPLPRVSCWLGVDGKSHHGVIVFIDSDPNNNKSLFSDECAICFQALSTHGKHHVCCLPCGHIYGLFCIKRWLLQRSSSGGGKCPQCNKLCTRKDIVLLYAGAHQKVASTTRYYPFTKQGSLDFEMDEKLRRADAKKNFTIDRQRRLDVLGLQNDIKDHWYELNSQWEDLSKKLEDKTGQEADALQQQVFALNKELNAVGVRYVVLQRRRTDVLNQRIAVFRRRYEEEYFQRLKFFNEMYKEHLAQQKKKKEKEEEDTSTHDYYHDSA